ncbi:hypothetical protein EV126DRAFT_428732 [Verticillium dahliae]|nr:hypothetical protein EV126DRAFT_428732 [Verticillium dahliae]
MPLCCPFFTCPSCAPLGCSGDPTTSFRLQIYTCLNMRADASPDRPRAKEYSTTPVADGSCAARLNLPASCDPPPLDRPGRQLVWAVRSPTLSIKFSRVATRSR